MSKVKTGNPDSGKAQPTNVKKKRGPKKGTKTKLKVRPSKDVMIENIELLSKEQMKKVMKNPRNAIRPSGKRKRKMLKRLRHGEKEKSVMQVDTEIAESQSKPETSKTKMRAKKMETDSLEEPKDSNDDVSMD